MVTVLHCSQNGSDKIWAYDPNLDLSFYGRTGRTLTQKAIDANTARKRIEEKVLKKGYVDVSHEYTIEAGALVSKSMASQKNNEWLVTLEHDISGDDIAEYLWHLTAPEFGDEIATLITNARSKVRSFFTPQPNDAKRLVLASIVKRYPTCRVYDENNNEWSIHQLLSNQTPREDLIALQLIQDIKTFKHPSSKDDGAYF